MARGGPGRRRPKRRDGEPGAVVEAWNHFPARRAWGTYWMHNRGFIATPHVERATRFRSGRSALAALRATRWAITMYEGVEVVAVPSNPPVTTHGQPMRESQSDECDWCPAMAQHFNEANHACDTHKALLLNLASHASEEAIEAAERERELGAYCPNTECASNPWSR